MAANQHTYKVEEFIIQGLKNGEERAFQCLNDKYFQALTFYTFRIIRHQAESEAIVNATLVKVWEKHADFDTLKNLLAFMYVTCRNAAIDHLKNRSKEILADDIQKHLPQEITEEHIVSEVVRAELLEEIYHELNNLPKQRREVIKLFYVDGYSMEQISKLLGMEKNLVRNIKSQALKQLRNKLMLRQLISLSICLHTYSFISF